MRPVEKRYLREFMPAMLAYVLVLSACSWLLKVPLAESGAAIRGAVALLPVLPIVLVLRAVVRVIRDSDELQRRIDLEAIAIAALVVGMGYFTLGLLAAAQVLAVTGKVALIWALPLLCLVYGVAKCLAQRRYR
jgi:hypothetical protein